MSSLPQPTHFRMDRVRYSPIPVLFSGIISALFLGVLLWKLAPDIPSQSENPAMEGIIQTILDAPAAESGNAGYPPSISPVFTPEVRHWESQIVAWSAEYGLDPNLTATLMQIESCGNPQAVSRSGAQGLFQVMPFHFDPGEDMLNPDTNAGRGLAYYVQSLELTNGHIGMAFAGYNGGHVAAQGTWETWSDETRRYYRWGSGIFQDASSGLEDSPTLHDWLAAGGASLCQQAAAALNLQ
ncbi:MAG: transglycosylase SLT domain-containing protein [Anaerolineales bacterium]|nr:transglycosylase SLT domain-containing protein [Anaerolineales bacterium]